MKNLSLLFISFFFFLATAKAQKITISGKITDKSSGELLIGANVYNQSTFQGTTSNAYGFYSLSINSNDSIVLVFSYIGFAAQVKKVPATKDLVINVALESSLNLKEVEIVESRNAEIQERTQMSFIEIPIEQIKNIPMLLGERDVIKAIQLLPGVQGGTEGSSGMYVRGGGADQNLILLDGVPIYNASHLFGFFSVFNPDALNSVELTKGGFPARYGGRLSSVLDIRMKEGNMKKFQGEGSIGIVAAKLTLEGPIIKDKTSFIVSGRRTYIDVLAQPFIRQQASQNGENVRAGYYFYDLNAKINHIFSETSRLYVSAYMGQDKAYTKFKSGGDSFGADETEGNLGWGNITTAIRWNKIFSKKLFANFTGTYSRYNFYTEQKSKFSNSIGGSNQLSEFSYNYNSGIFDFTGKVDFDYYLNPENTIKFGAGNIYHTFTPGVNAFSNSGIGNLVDTSFGANKVFAHEYYVYFEDDIKLTEKLKMNLGAHFSGFKLSNKNYTSFQPRIAARYLINKNLSVKAAFTQMTQYIHLLTTATIGLPTDLWVPATEKIKPMNSNQYAAGFAYTLKKDYEFSIEGYYKTMDNVIEYKSGATFLGNSQNWEDKVESGKGWSYGSEFLIQKKSGKWTGWIGYTLSWTWRQFEELNFGEKFPYRYDRRHDIDFTMNYKFNDRINASITWVYGTGNAVTLPTERFKTMESSSFFQFQNAQSTVDFFEKRNGFREPSYHRLDVGVNFVKQKKWGERTWSWGLYNAYSRRNPFYLFFDEQNGQRVLKQISIFPIIPSVTYSFKF